MHQEGRLQSVVEMTENLRLDVSSNKRNIDNLHQRAIAVRTERDGMVTTLTELNGTIAQQGVTITELNGTITQQGVTITELNGSITQQGVTITQQGVTITELNGTITELNGTITQQGVTITELTGTVDYLKGREIANKIERDGDMKRVQDKFDAIEKRDVPITIREAMI